MGRARVKKLALTEAQAIDFGVFWSVYPRRQAKKDAKDAWAQLSPTELQVEQIYEAIAWQVGQAAWEDPQFIPLPATWLRAERWSDEPQTQKRQPVLGKRTTLLVAALRNIAAEGS